MIRGFFVLLFCLFSFSTFAQFSGSAFSATTATALGRTLVARFGDTINIKDSYNNVPGAVGDGLTDDSAALASAIAVYNARAALGSYPCIYAPGGSNYLISNGAAIPPFMTGTPGCIVGDGPDHTNFTLSSTFSGDLFAWSGSWIVNVSGPIAIGFRVNGNMGAGSQQNALMFYDQNDNVFVDRVDVSSLPGRALEAGMEKNNQVAYIRESHIDNLRIFNSGKTNIPVFEITSQCTAANCSGIDATNEIDVGRLDVYASLGPSVTFRNGEPVSTGVLRQIRINQLRIEGQEGNPNNATADLLQIGDASMPGGVANINCTQCELISPYTNYRALRITGPALAASPQSVSFDGLISQGGGGGGGIQLDAVRGFAFHGIIGSAQTNITVASSTTTAGPIYIDALGTERYLTYSIDPTAVQYTLGPGHVFGAASFQSALTFTSAQIPDGGVSGGSVRGMNSTDWQTARFYYTQVSGGLNSTISGGANNSASGSDSVVSGGNQNTAGGYRSVSGGGYGNLVGGQYSVIPGGVFGFDNYRTSVEAFSGGEFTQVGDAQHVHHVLRGTTSTAVAVRLTGDGSTANNNSTNNCINIPLNTRAAIGITVTATDNTATANGAIWNNWLGKMTKGATASATALSMSTLPTPMTDGSGSNYALSASADTTLGCLNLTFTPPSGNTDTIHVVADVNTLEAH